MDILSIIYAAFDEINQDLEADEQIVKSEDTIIFGPDSKIDSMGLVNLITIIEEQIEEKSGKFVSIADEKAMSLVSSPFKSVATLKKYIESLLNEG